MSVNNGDDFEDEHDPVEDEAFDDEQAGDEDWDEYEDQPTDENLDNEAGSSASAAKKKAGSFNKILIGAGVLLVGGMIVMQLGKGTPTPPPPPPVAATATAQPEPAPAGMLGSAEELAKMAEMAKHNAQPVMPEPVPAAPPMPAPMSAPEKGVEKIAETPQAAQAVPGEAPAPVKPVEASPRMPRAQDMMLKTAAPPEVTPAPAPTLSGSPDTAALNMKMDSILSRLTLIEGEVADLKKTQGPAEEETASEITSLKAAVAALEKKISASSNKTQDSDSSAGRVKKAVAADKSAAVTPVEKQAAQILGDADSAPETGPVVEPVIQKTEGKPVRVSTVWVLKGAQPGQATVAKAGESDSRTVRVGDTLPGIGRITAVEYQNGRWAVIGAQGRINQ